MTEEATSGRVLVGPAGWSYADWKGIVYPPDMPRGLHPLRFLCGFFDTAEVNATFYRPADPRHCAAWMQNVSENPRFRFTVKLWGRFTHERETWPEAGAVKRFCAGIAPLAEADKLGAILVQFPWSFRRTPENRQWLARVVETFAAYPLAIEFRHASWDCPEVYAGLTEHKIAFCNIDQPMFEDSIAPSDRVTAPFGYIRFHGRNREAWFREGAGRNERYNYLYSEDELRPWIARIQQMKKQVNDLFIVTNNHYRGQAVVNALEIMSAIGYGKYTIPLHLIEHYPRLKHVVRESAGS